MPRILPLRSAARGLALACALAAAPPARAQQPGGITLDEVLRTTLTANAAVRTAAWEVERQAAGVRVAHGAYDPQVTATLSSFDERNPAFGTQGAPGIIQSSSTVTYSLGVDQPFRSGLVVTPSLSFSRLDAVGEAVGPRNQAVASLGVTMPLLRGRGGGLVAAGERSAVMLHSASEADLRYRRSLALLEATEAYWSYAAAYAHLQVLRETEERSTRIVEQTRTLVAADERPAVDLLPLEANLASRRAARISGERALITARQELGRAMGIAPAEVMRLPPPSTDFPAGPAGEIADDSTLVRRALRERADLEAARRQRDASRDLLAGYRGETRPRLDLTLTLGYQGLEAGDELGRWVSPFYSELGGMHTRLEVSYGMPLRNRLADGRLLQGAAAEQQAALTYAELARQVELDAAAAMETLRLSAEELAQFGVAARLHADALDSEQRRYRLGTSTIFDIINAEEGLTSATLAEIDARARFAVSLARLRHVTGTLLGDEGARADALTRWEN